MFALTRADLTKAILGCADGPASFNADATRRGSRVVSCDPIYKFTELEIRQRIEATRHTIVAQTRQNMDEFVWTSITSVEQLERVRMEAMDCFLADYEAGGRSGRYVAAQVQTLPFNDRSFNLALCSHFLFLYSEQLGEAFHQAAVLELCRVADEVRIFPLVALGGQRSRFVAPVRDRLHSLGFDVSVEVVPYEFQRGANEMLRVGRTNVA
jgi:hypothetical protein